MNQKLIDVCVDTLVTSFIGTVVDEKEPLPMDDETLLRKVTAIFSQLTANEFADDKSIAFYYTYQHQPPEAYQAFVLALESITISMFFKRSKQRLACYNNTAPETSKDTG